MCDLACRRGLILVGDAKTLAAGSSHWEQYITWLCEQGALLPESVLQSVPKSEGHHNVQQQYNVPLSKGAVLPAPLDDGTTATGHAPPIHASDEPRAGRVRRGVVVSGGASLQQPNDAAPVAAPAAAVQLRSRVARTTQRTAPALDTPEPENSENGVQGSTGSDSSFPQAVSPAAAVRGRVVRTRRATSRDAPQLQVPPAAAAVGSADGAAVDGLGGPSGKGTDWWAGDSGGAITIAAGGDSEGGTGALRDAAGAESDGAGDAADASAAPPPAPRARRGRRAAGSSSSSVGSSSSGLTEASAAAAVPAVLSAAGAAGVEAAAVVAEVTPAGAEPSPPPAAAPKRRGLKKSVPDV